MFYRKAPHSLRSCDTLRLILINKDSKQKPIITKTQKFHKNTDVSARSRWDVKKNSAFLRFHILWNFRYRRQISKIWRRRESRGLRPMVYFFGIFFRTSEKSAAAMCRFNFREQARENNKLNLSRKHARLTAINSSSQTQSNAKTPFN